ncbi:MAG: prolipoprotein diacylglyceryl transferase [Oligosphaeraceae bacterium]
MSGSLFMVSLPSPVIFSLGHFQLRWYGLFAVLAMLTGYGLMVARRKRYGFTVEELSLLLNCSVIFGVIGARLEFVRRFWGELFARDLPGIFRVWEGGLVFQGGFVVAALAILGLCRWRRWPAGRVGDMMAPALPAAHAVARLGCLFNGCCFGIPWSHWGAVLYPAQGNDVLNTQLQQGLLSLQGEAFPSPLPVLPVQALETLWCLLVAGLLLLAEKRGLAKGRLFFLYLLGYSAGRFLLEFLRGDYHHAGLLTPAQWTTALVILPATLAAFLWTKYRKTTPRPQERPRP